MTSVRPLNPRSQRAWDEFRVKIADSGGIVLETAWLGSHKGHLVRCSAGHKYKPAPREVGEAFVCGMCFENLELWYSPQPYGQRVADLLQYAVTHHREALRDLLGEPMPGATSPHAA